MTEEKKAELEFPQEYPFKVFVKPSMVSEEQLLQVILSLLGRSDCIRKVSTRSSKTKKYLSYTIAVDLKTRAELDSIYAAFKKMDGIPYLL